MKSVFRPCFAPLALVLCAGMSMANTTQAQAAAQQTAAQVAKDNKVEKAGYGFIAAGGWISLKNDLGNAALAGPAVVGKLNPSFIVEVRTLPKELTPSLGKVRDVQIAELPQVVKNFKLISEKTVKLPPANTLALRWNYTGRQNDQFFQWTQLVAIRNGKLYTVTLALPEGTKREVAMAGQKMLDSFYFR